MSTMLSIRGETRAADIQCADDGVIWIRTADSAVALDLTWDQLEALNTATADARSYRSANSAEDRARHLARVFLPRAAPPAR